MKVRMMSGLIIAFGAFVFGQTSAEQITFDSASIKPAPLSQPARGTLSGLNWSQGGPGSKDPRDVSMPQLRSTLFDSAGL